MKNSFGILIFVALATAALTFSACEEEQKGYKISGMLNDEITLTKGVNSVKAAITTYGDLLASAQIRGGAFTLVLPEMLNTNLLEPIKKTMSDIPATISISDTTTRVATLTFFAYNANTPIGTLLNYKTVETFDSVAKTSLLEFYKEDYIYSNKKVTIAGIDSTDFGLGLSFTIPTVYAIQLNTGWNRIYSAFKIITDDSSLIATEFSIVNNVPLDGIVWQLENEQNTGGDIEFMPHAFLPKQALQKVFRQKTF